MLWHIARVGVGGRVNIWKANLFLNCAVPSYLEDSNVTGPKAVVLSVTIISFGFQHRGCLLYFGLFLRLSLSRLKLHYSG